MQVPVWFGMAAACLLGLSTASTHAALQVHAQPANTRDVQFHSYLEQAAEAMQKGDLAPLLKKLRRALAIDPRSLAAVRGT
jgi:Tfp pilus assembly protein PilF